MLENLIYYIPSAVLLGYLANRFYFCGRQCKNKKRLDGKTVIITGANCGIGYETALDMAKRGAQVILACRDPKRAQEAANKIIAESKNDKVEVELVDLGDLESIREFSKRIVLKCRRIDILINNAGLSTYGKTKDGFEISFGVNHLGHFYLTNLLLDLIQYSAPSRIINVSSEAHKYTKMHWDNLNGLSGIKAYCQSKLANVLFTIELAKRLKGTGVTTFSLHPGFVRTEIGRNMNIFLKSIFLILRPILFMLSKSRQEGAQTTIYCAVDDDILENSGSYFDNCRLQKLSAEASDPKSAEKLWEISSRLVGLN